MKFPTLYKLNNTGSIQFWNIEVLSLPTSVEDVTFIRITYGQLGTDSPQTTSDVIKEGKNVGKKNETSIWDQAVHEATSKWEKQQKKGYVNSVEMAELGGLSSLIEGGIVPMLAHTFEKQGHKIKYPCYVQPKLDGIRCIAIANRGTVTLWSRTRKQITSMPHIVEEIHVLACALRQDFILDGELYNHEFKDDFEKIVSSVRKENPEEGYLNVQYHIYDLAEEGTFKERNFRLNSLIGNDQKYIKLVDIGLVHNDDNVVEWFQCYKSQGYEGAMLRNADGLYVNKRSSDLIKVKEMQDDEFEIIGIEEGRGKLAGHVGAFVCRTRDGQEFKAKPAGDTGRLREYFCNHGLWEGRQLVVQFQDLTSYGIPRFPVGLRLKEQI